ncbi:hypothetical protein BGY98DRAFT_939525 [Russula aff. rugulosa BPL654]|nr:hypothetical protein BGY98DRAFT_939525 [Russula aff. rugulosa BPL654]
MALKAIRRSTGNNAFDWMVTSAQIASNVSSMLQFPPTMAATTVLLSVLQIIADVKTNQQDCVQLAQRAARLLMDLGRRMEGKWEDAPQSLLENIRELEARANEMDQSIGGKDEHTGSVDAFDQQLKDAAMSFQVRRQIHCFTDLGAMKLNFRRYHQSDVIVRKANRKAVGWFEGTSEAHTGAMGERHKDVEESSVRVCAIILVASNADARHGSHENLPQILGYSDGMAQTPFILLANVQCRDLASTMRSALTTRSLANCASLILKTSAIAHAQQQLSLSESDAQDFIDHATYSIDSDNNVIVGLPPPREGWVTARSYCLEESLSDRALHYLKEVMNAEEAALQAASCQTSTSLNKYKQLKGLLQCLLPRQREGLGLSAELEDLLDDADEDNPLTLRAYGPLHKRIAARPNVACPGSRRGPHSGGLWVHPRRLDRFCKLCTSGNIQDGPAKIESKGNDGSRWQDTWHDAPASMMRGSYLSRARVTRLGAWHPTHDIILVTRFMRIDDHQVEDWRPAPLPPPPGMGRAIPPFGAPAFPQHGGFGAAPAFPHQGFGAQALSVPSIVYLITLPGRTSPPTSRMTLWAARVRAQQDPHRGVLVAALDIRLDTWTIFSLTRRTWSHNVCFVRTSVDWVIWVTVVEDTRIELPWL